MPLTGFFFQAEDGIRYYKVTGVQTCSLPISLPSRSRLRPLRWPGLVAQLLCAGNPARSIRRLRPHSAFSRREIGRASCRERVWMSVDGESMNKTGVKELQRMTTDRQKQTQEQ